MIALALTRGELADHSPCARLTLHGSSSVVRERFACQVGIQYVLSCVLRKMARPSNMASMKVPI
jgi:hypothetical protein